MKEEAFHSALGALQSGAPPRVWSLIVTIFGDLARAPDAAISGPVLMEVLKPLGIKPEAMRVALHRLRNEGWLSAHKEGRTSLHALTAHGHRESEAASTRIYARANPSQAEWTILCRPNAAALPKGFIQIAPGVGLSNQAANGITPEDLILTDRVDHLPSWIMADRLPKGAESDLRDLDAAMDIVLSELDRTSPTPLQSACLRGAIVHQWRRLVLKLPDVPDALFGAEWIGFACRKKVHAALDRLPKPDLSDLA